MDIGNNPLATKNVFFKYKTVRDAEYSKIFNLMQNFKIEHILFYKDCITGKKSTQVNYSSTD